ncbi:hypothetical protein CSUI_000364 [Cystoisospora suis]|uniref:Uncharacterized protein n=1 Tax=Cystoisospora suis TaxID=483139 RepID=A0A2C6LH79_9APIC|nr:hypothetical protein CSUI_000364 [Cystoisospora suis]
MFSRAALGLTAAVACATVLFSRYTLFVPVTAMVIGIDEAVESMKVLRNYLASVNNGSLARLPRKTVEQAEIHHSPRGRRASSRRSRPDDPGSTSDEEFGVSDFGRRQQAGFHGEELPTNDSFDDFYGRGYTRTTTTWQGERYDNSYTRTTTTWQGERYVNSYTRTTTTWQGERYDNNYTGTTTTWYGERYDNNYTGTTTTWYGERYDSSYTNASTPAPSDSLTSRRGSLYSWLFSSHQRLVNEGR